MVMGGYWRREGERREEKGVLGAVGERRIIQMLGNGLFSSGERGACGQT